MTHLEIQTHVLVTSDRPFFVAVMNRDVSHGGIIRDGGAETAILKVNEVRRGGPACDAMICLCGTHFFCFEQRHSDRYNEPHHGTDHFGPWPFSDSRPHATSSGWCLHGAARAPPADPLVPPTRPQRGPLTPGRPARPSSDQPTVSPGPPGPQALPPLPPHGPPSGSRGPADVIRSGQADNSGRRAVSSACCADRSRRLGWWAADSLG